MRPNVHYAMKERLFENWKHKETSLLIGKPYRNEGRLEWNPQRHFFEYMGASRTEMRHEGRHNPVIILQSDWTLPRHDPKSVKRILTFLGPTKVGPDAEDEWASKSDAALEYVATSAWDRARTKALTQDAWVEKMFHIVGRRHTGQH